MGFFSKAPTELEVTTNFLKVLAGKTIQLDDATRNRVGPIILASVGQFLNYENLKATDIQNSYSMFQIISGTSGMTMSTSFSQYSASSVEPDLDEIGSLILDGIPFEIPVVVIGPLRYMMVEYLTRSSLDEVARDNLKKDWFFGSDYEVLIDLIIAVVDEINSLCLSGSFKQPKYEVATLADFIQIFIYSLDFHAKA